MSVQQMQPASVPGRRPKGTKKQSVSFPTEHHDTYQKAADELGVSFSTYVAWVMAQSTNQPMPQWITDEIKAGQNKRLQEELPMARTA